MGPPMANRDIHCFDQSLSYEKEYLLKQPHRASTDKTGIGIQMKVRKDFVDIGIQTLTTHILFPYQSLG